MDYLNFSKLLWAGKFYAQRNKTAVSLNQFTDDDVADLLDDQMASVEQDTETMSANVNFPSAPSMKSIQEQMASVTVEKGGSSLTSNYAKKSLKIFEYLKFPQTPITYKEMQSFKSLLENNMRSVNLDHFLDVDFDAPLQGDKDYEQYVQDNKFAYSGMVELVMDPNHEVCHIILTEDVENNRKVAWEKLISHYDNETIEKFSLVFYITDGIASVFIELTWVLQRIILLILRPY